MNQSHKQQLEQAIAKYQAHDAGAAFAAAYPDQTDLSVEVLGPMTGEQFILFSDRVISNFEEVLRSGLWSAFPNRMQVPTLNIPDIPQLLDQFIALIGANNCTDANVPLNQLIKVQLYLGIWGLADKTKSPNRSEVLNISKRLDVQLKRLEAAQATLTELMEAGEKERKGLNAFTAEKKREFEEIRSMLAEAKKHLNDLTALVEQARNTDSEIKAVHDRGKKLIEELGVELGVIKKAFEGFQDDSKELIEEQTKNTGEAKSTMEKTNMLYEFVKGKEQEIIKLLGMAADAALGTKYDDRGQKIGKGLRFWQWAVPGSVVVAVAWVIVVFTCLKTTEFNEWVDLGINLLKTSPAFILMGFVFTQYSKERNLQEEWLFKAAVAMTINTYADALEDKDGESNKSRQQLILNALQQVHSPPHLYSEKGGTLFSLRAKELRSVLESLNETMRTLKPGG